MPFMPSDNKNNSPSIAQGARIWQSRSVIPTAILRLQYPMGADTRLYKHQPSSGISLIPATLSTSPAVFRAAERIAVASARDLGMTRIDDFCFWFMKSWYSFTPGVGMGWLTVRPFQVALRGR